MLSPDCLRELETSWLPNLTSAGLNRLIDLLEQGSPLLIRGSFTRVLPMGCLATHAAWHHPETAHLTLDAGVCWLNQVARLNPATSHVIRAWDCAGENDFELRAAFLTVLKEHRQRQAESPEPANRVAELVNS